MHEIGIVDDIIDAINAKLKKSAGNSKVIKVNIAIGELEHVSDDHFEFHFREHAKGTLLEDAELNFKKVRPVFRCKSCGSEFSGQEGMAGCPACKSRINDIIQGRGIRLDSIEIL